MIALARRVLKLTEAAVSAGNEDALADALEAAEQLVAELEERIRRLVEEEEEEGRHAA